MDLKFNKIINFFLSKENFRVQKLLLTGLLLPSTYIKYCTLKHKLILESVLKLKKCSFSYLQNILNCQAGYPFKYHMSVPNFNDCLNDPIALRGFYILLSKTGNRRLDPISICDEGDELVGMISEISH